MWSWGWIKQDRGGYMHVKSSCQSIWKFTQKFANLIRIVCYQRKIIEFIVGAYMLSRNIYIFLSHLIDFVLPTAHTIHRLVEVGPYQPLTSPPAFFSYLPSLAFSLLQSLRPFWLSLRLFWQYFLVSYWCVASPRPFSSLRPYHRSLWWYSSYVYYYIWKCISCYFYVCEIVIDNIYWKIFYDSLYCN